MTPAQSLIGRRFRMALGSHPITFAIVAVEPSRVLTQLVDHASAGWLSVDLLIDALHAGDVIEVSEPRREVAA